MGGQWGGSNESHGHLVTCFVSPNLVPRVLSYSSPEARGKGPGKEVVKVLVRHLESGLN